MAESLRILTYNTQLRSWWMEAGAQQNPFPTTSYNDRAQTIAQRILQSLEDYDIVCLNEVFDPAARDILARQLGEKYPNAILNADVDNLGLQIGTLAGIPLATPMLLAPPAVGLLAIGVITGLLSPKLQDSGLMMFSRLPFATWNPPPEARDMLASYGWHDSAFPVVEFVPYTDGANDDRFAAKGVVYARFVRANGEPLHVLASHTQSDPTTSRGQNAGVRTHQFDQVSKLIEQMIGPDRLNEEVIFCGDLNVDGAFHEKDILSATAVSQEWRNLFSHGKFTDVLHDVWHYEQCPGFDTSGKPVLPDNFDRGITIYNRDNERLDYFLRPTPYEGRLATQHIAIAYDIAQGTESSGFTSYTSDHLPLKIDLNFDRPRATVITSEPIPFSTGNAPTPPPDVTVTGLLDLGQMDWFRIDEPGGYGIRLTRGADRVKFEVYEASNLSVPLEPFSVIREPAVERNPYGTRYALPDPPFFIRVFHQQRDEEVVYELQVHRFAGTSPRDAIPLPVGIPVRGETHTGAPHCLDNTDTPFDEFDSVWFVTQLDADANGAIPVEATVTITDADQNAFGLLVLATDAGNFSQVVEQPQGRDLVVASFEYQRPQGGYILARRREDNPSFSARSFTIKYQSNLNYLYGRLPRALAPSSLFCEDESDGFLGNEFGSDDISFNIKADGTTVLHVDNSDDLEFDDDTRRDLDPWVDIVRYTREAQVELVELDDLSAADRTATTIPTYDEVRADGTYAPNTQEGKVHAGFRLAFQNDDGIYHLHITVSNRPPGG